MASDASMQNRPRTSRATPPHPLYEDEITEQQIDVIRRLADPEGVRASKRLVLYPSVA